MDILHAYFFYTFAPIKTIKQKTIYEKGIGTPF